MLSSLPNVAKRMSDFDLFKGYLRLLERMITLAPRGMRPMLNNIDLLTSRLTLGGLRRWILYGAETFNRDFNAQIAYFELSSSESLKILEQERRGTLFIDNQRKLQFYLRAFYNRDFFLRPTSGDYEPRALLCLHKTPSDLERPRPWWEGMDSDCLSVLAGLCRGVGQRMFLCKTVCC